MKQFLNFLFLTIFSITTFGQNLKISELSSLTNAGVATLDVFPIVDVSANQTKKFSIGEFDLRYGFTVTAPLSKTAGASPVVSIPVATSSADGYLSSTNWSTFNNKVSLTGTEALTNKDYDGGTASNTSRLTIPKAAKTTLDALTRKQGTIVYDTTSNKPYYDNGTTLTVVGSGSGGGKNFVEGGDAEAGTTGWATFDDGAASSPVNGTGGSPSVVTWSTTATTPLESLNSFTYTKTGSDAQGEGVAYTFSVDPAYRAKVVNISFDYILSSGTFAAGTSSDVSVWIYDVTNSQLIQPSSYRLLSNSTTTADKFQGTFQTSSSGASYRLILFSGTTSTSAYTLKIDNVSVAPSSYVFGTPVTDWQSWTPTGSWSTNTTYSGFYRRVGGEYEYQIKLSLSGAPTAASLTVNLPSGHVIDTAKLADTSAAYGQLPGSTAQIGFASSSSGVSLIAKYNSTTSVALYSLVGNFSPVYNANVVTHVAPVTLANTDFILIYLKLPIVGLSSSVQMSDQTDSRVVSFSGEKSGGSQAVTGLTTDITFASVKDTHGGWGGSSYTVKVPGDYIVSTSVYSAASVANTFIFKNGTTFTGLNNSPANTLTAGSALIPGLVVGDTISLRTAASITIAGDSAIKFGISRVAGPNQIAASESIRYSGRTSVATSLTSGSFVNIPFGTDVEDTHDAWNGTVFTVPSAGSYALAAQVAPNTGSWTQGRYLILGIYKNGSLYKNATKYIQYTASQIPETVSVVDLGIPCNAGDTLEVRFTHNNATSQTLNGTADENYIAIYKIK